MNKNNLRFTLLGIVGLGLVVLSLTLLMYATGVQDGICAIVALILSTAITAAAILSLDK